MKKIIVWLNIIFICFISIGFCQHSDRLFKDIDEYDRSDTQSELGVSLFNYPWDGEMYLHPLSGGYFYEISVVSDATWHRIVYGRVKFNSSGSFVYNSAKLWSKGTRGNGNQKFFRPKGIAVSYHDTDNMDVYVADSGNNRIVKFTLNLNDGNISSENYFYANSHGGFNNPVDVAVDYKNNQNPYDDEIFVVDSWNHRIVLLSAVDGTVILTYGSYGNGTNQLRKPTSITMARCEDQIYSSWLWVSDNGNNRIVNLVYPGSVIIPDVIYQFPQTTEIMDINRDNTGYCLYAVDRNSHKIHKFYCITFGELNKTGEYGTFGIEANELYYPNSISLPVPLTASGGGYWGASEGGILELWLNVSGIKHFNKEGVDIIDLSTNVNQDGTLMSYSYKIPSGVGIRKEKIKNKYGTAVKTICDGVLTYGDIVSGNWDKRDDSGNLLPSDNYTLEVRFESYWNDGSDPLDYIVKSSSFNMLSPPVITDVSVVNTNNIRLTFNEVPGADSYNIYRGTDAYFTPDKAGGSNREATGVTDQDPGTEGVQWTDTDNVVGDPSTNYFYVVTAVGPTESENSNRGGEFDYELITTPSTDINEIVVVLDTRFSSQPVETAEELANAIPNCTDVFYWDASGQGTCGYVKGLPVGNFPLYQGYPYMVNVTNNCVWTITGTVMDISFILITTTSTDVNHIGIPFSKSHLTDAEELAQDIPNCTDLYYWNVEEQGFYGYVKGLPFGNFPVQAGYPYYVNITEPCVWPETTGQESSSDTTTNIAEHHIVYGTFTCVDSTVTLGLRSWIKNRSEEILTDVSTGSGIEENFWWVGVTNFPSGWNVSDTLVVVLEDSEGLYQGNTEIELTLESVDGPVAVAVNEKIVLDKDTTPDNYEELAGNWTTKSSTGGRGFWGGTGQVSYSSSAHARWQKSDITGNYCVYVYFGDFEFGEDQVAKYTVHHIGGTSEFQIDQNDSNNCKKWLDFGIFTFSGNFQIDIECITDPIVADAVKLVSFSPSTEPEISVIPESLSFNATVGDSGSMNQQITVINTGGGTLSWTASEAPDTSWMSLSDTSGCSGAQLTVSVDITGLSTGTYSGNVRVSDPDATNNPVDIPVTLTVNPQIIEIILDRDITPDNYQELAGNWTTKSSTGGRGFWEGTGQVSYSSSAHARWQKHNIDGRFCVYVYFGDWEFGGDQLAEYTVYHIDGTSEFQIDQNDPDNCKQWLELGIFSFDSTFQVDIECITDPIVADAVKLVSSSPAKYKSQDIYAYAESGKQIPEKFAIMQNYPNPFNPVTKINFQLPESRYVLLKIFNIFGQEICTLLDKQYEPGYHCVIWNGKDKNGHSVSGGVYIYKIRAGEFIDMKKMILLR